MEVFRAQQRPTWRVWLNTVHAFLLPEDTASLWRPALAFASIALLVTVSVIGYRNYIADEQGQLAEVRREKAETPLPKVQEPGVTEPGVPEPVDGPDAALDNPVPAIEEVQAEKVLQEDPSERCKEHQGATGQRDGIHGRGGGGCSGTDAG